MVCHIHVCKAFLSSYRVNKKVVQKSELFYIVLRRMQFSAKWHCVCVQLLTATKKPISFVKSQLHKDRKKALTNVHSILSAPLRGHLSSLGQPILRTLATFRVLNSVFSVSSFILVSRLYFHTQFLRHWERKS